MKPVAPSPPTNAMWSAFPLLAMNKMQSAAVFPMAATVPWIVGLVRPVKRAAPMCPTNVVKGPVCPPPARPKEHNAEPFPTAATAPLTVADVSLVKLVAW